MSNKDYATAPSSQSPRLGMLTNPPLLHSPPAPTTSTSLTTTMLHGLAAPRTRFVVAGLTAVSLNVGSIPAACALGALYVAGNGINFYQVLCRPRADDDSIRAVDCVLEAFISLLCASLFLRAVNISPETDKSL